MPAKPARDAQVAGKVMDAAPAQTPPRPSLAAIRRWPPTCRVEDAALALGVAKATLYDWIKTGKCPVATISVGHQRIRTQVVTASLLRLLEGTAA